MNLEFTTEPIKVPVTVDGESYTLQETSGAQAAKYRNSVLACTIFGKDGKPVGMKDFANNEALLVSMCLTRDSDGKKLSPEEIRNWPARIVTVLANKALQISGLGQGDEVTETAKNGLSEITDGSD